jgi:hypothetical protein
MKNQIYALFKYSVIDFHFLELLFRKRTKLWSDATIDSNRSFFQHIILHPKMQQLAEIGQGTFDLCAIFHSIAEAGCSVAEKMIKKAVKKLLVGDFEKTRIINIAENKKFQ